jgi:hypothetical protein
VEIAEQAAFNLYQHMDAAPDMAFRWMASPRELYQICGFHILNRLFLQGMTPNERGINEFIDQALAAIEGPSVAVRKAALNALNHFSSLGLLYERLADNALRSIGSADLPTR